ncbi:T9SS type A sorting domain-containing protein [Hymenobacter aquaticus]|uniref:T9SS type A sorting domain-containing protein n=1 Tax=Hymenobacter aquaticus TaxID=1867101 RepID=A0A4Z0PV53_9BACT|nr:kelch repeat-containing protein [Hymenobacter aquaticus]TGE21660.1 T9SS type A sorting domain-containing protein [Hymenobacter aquaticus]
MKKFLPALALVALAMPVTDSAWAQVTRIPGQLYPGSTPGAAATVTHASRMALPALPQARIQAPWTALASMSQIRGQHAAVALNGKIYVWGGYVGTYESATTEFSSLEIYNPATNTWSAGANYPTLVRGQAHTVGQDGLIYSFGNGFAGTDAYRYNPATNTWAAIAPQPTGTWEASAITAPDGKIYLFGGFTSNNPTSPITQIYNPATNTWASGASMTVGRHGHAGVLDAAGRVHIIGGTNSTNGGNTAITSHEIYTIATNTWSTGAALPVGINQPGAVLGADGKIYIIGGKQSYYNNATPFYATTYVYDLSTNSWSAGTSLPIVLGENRAVTIGGDIYTVGGCTGAAPSTTGTQQSVLYRTSVTNSYTWTGATSTNWNVASNWSGGVVPTATDNVTIPAGLSRYPSVSTPTAAASVVTVNGGASLSIADGGTLSVAGNFVNNGTFDAAGNATVSLTGSTAQTVGGTSMTQFRNLTVGAAGASLSGQVEIQRLLTLNGNLSTNGQRFLILSNNVGTAMVVNNGGVVTGSTVVQRYIDVASNAGFGYRHLAPAVSGATLSNLTIFPILPGAQPAGPIQFNAAYNSAAEPGLVTPYPTIFSYDQNRVGTVAGPAGFNQGWASPTAASQILTPTLGYTINEPAGNFFELTGTSLNTGNISRVGMGRVGQADGGWHLIGNPYPAPIDWNRVGRTNLDAAAYVYRSTGQYAGGYTSYVNGVGVNILPMGQAFFVRVSTVGASGSVNFTNASRETTFSDPAYSRPARTETRPLLQLTLQRQGATDATAQDDFYVYEETGATSGFDSAFDALKVQLNGGEQPSLYQLAGSEALAIQGLPADNAPRSLALGMYAAVGGSYTFVPAQLLNFATTEPLWLEDKLTGTWHDLRQGAYSVQLSQGPSTSRFVLHLHQARPLANGKANTWAGEVQLFPNPATGGAVTVAVSGVAGATAELTLLNGVGQRVWQHTAAITARELRGSVPVAGLAKGIYTLQVRSSAGLLTRKLVVQ